MPKISYKVWKNTQYRIRITHELDISEYEEASESEVRVWTMTPSLQDK